jgi:hypothetical protein
MSSVGTATLRVNIPLVATSGWHVGTLEDA